MSWKVKDYFTLCLWAYYQYFVCLELLLSLRVCNTIIGGDGYICLVADICYLIFFGAVGRFRAVMLVIGASVDTKYLTKKFNNMPAIEKELFTKLLEINNNIL